MHSEKQGPFLSQAPQDVELAASLLKEGHVVALPTETVYGLAADALNPDAVRKIFTVKGRPLMDPLIVHVLDLYHAAQIAEINPLGEKLAEVFWPGPLTIILPKKTLVPLLVTANQPSVAIRAPKHPLFRAVLEASGLCLAAPSANPFGYVSPTRAEHVQKTLGEQIPHIMDGGPCEHGLESTILSLIDPENPIILRPGPITPQDLEAVLGKKISCSQTEVDLSHEDKNPVSVAAPGLLKQHYSPKTPLYLVDKEALDGVDPSIAYVFWKRPKQSSLVKSIYWLTEDGSPEEAAKGAYHLLQTLDNEGHKAIFFEKPPEGDGLYLALKNRLQKAANKFR